MELPPKKTRKRIEERGTVRFLTFSCYRRLKLFSNDRIKDHFVERLAGVSERMNMEVITWVVMPEHIHLIVATNDSVPISEFLLALKRPFATEILNRWRKLDAGILPKLRDRAGKHHFWQAGGGYDRNIIGDELIEKIRYCHLNPVKRGLCERSVDWKWSSAKQYVGEVLAIGPTICMDLLPMTSKELL